ncbi:MAG: prepilin-type N-terminal cleavage/methylation domain-containing protein [Gammaproteobacteria bacterium]
MQMDTSKLHAKGFSLIELTITIIITSILLAALYSVLNPTLNASQATQKRNEVIHNARYAMEKMVHAVNRSPQILLPYNDKALTSYPDNIREQTNPASAPPSGSTLATAVLAIKQDPTIDLDGDGIVDVDNDGDGRIDEDYPGDMTNDSEPGIKGIDDDGDGQVDEGFSNRDDDEYVGFSDEDPVDGVDNDGDNNVDEDSPADMNKDSEPGIAGVDDDGDGAIDEGSDEDDDEDGVNNEDWCDPVVFYMQAGALIERIPVPWDTNSSGTITGEDYIETILVENVSRFRVERVPQNSDRVSTVELTLEITPPNGEMFNLTTRARVGGAL